MSIVDGFSLSTEKTDTRRGGKVCSFPESRASWLGNILSHRDAFSIILLGDLFLLSCVTLNFR